MKTPTQKRKQLNEVYWYVGVEPDEYVLGQLIAQTLAEEEFYGSITQVKCSSIEGFLRSVKKFGIVSYNNYRKYAFPNDENTMVFSLDINTPRWDLATLRQELRNYLARQAAA